MMAQLDPKLLQLAEQYLQPEEIFGRTLEAIQSGRTESGNIPDKINNIYDASKYALFGFFAWANDSRHATETA